MAATATTLSNLEQLAFILLGWASMSRPSDLANIRTDGIIFKPRMNHHTMDIFFPFQKNYNGQARRLTLVITPFLTPVAYYVRMTQPVVNGQTPLPLFPSLNTSAPAVVIQRSLQHWLPGFLWTGKSLRIGAISEAFHRGYSIPQVMAVSGHKTESSTLRYYHQQATQMRMSVQLAMPLMIQSSPA